MGSKAIEPSKELLKRLLDIEKLKYCQECGACTAGCPMSRAVPEHYNVRSLLLKIVLDLEKVLTEEELWLCAWCYRCYERCPQGLKPTEIFLLTRNFAVEGGNLPDQPKALLWQVLKTGRTMAVTEDIDDWRMSLGLPKIGPTVSERAMEEIKKITDNVFKRRLEKL